MDSRNNSGQSEKQKELVRRLEEIRRQRGTTERRNAGQRQAKSQSESRRTSQTPRRNEGQQERPSRPSQRTTNRQENPFSRRQPNADRLTQPTYRQQPTIEEGDPITSSESISDLSKIDEISESSTPYSRKKNSSKMGKNVVRQLSQGDGLAQAFILNEVLSKPIALRKKYR